MWRQLYLIIARRLIWSDISLLVKLLLSLLAMVAVFTWVFYRYEEGVSLGDALWTAYISLTTVGYGDYSAKTWQGRIVTVGVTFFGIGCLTLFAGTVIDKLLERKLKKMRGETEYEGEDHIVIVNISSYEKILELLNEIDSCREYENVSRVLVAEKLPDNDKELPEKLIARVDAFIRGIPSSLETLQKVNIEKAKACLLLSDVSQPTIDDVNTLTAGIIEKNWPHVVTVLDCVRGDTIKNLDHFNIDGGVNSTELQMGLLVHELKAPGTFEVYSQLSSNARGQQVYISECPFHLWPLPEEGLTMGELKKVAVTADLPLTVMGVQRGEKGDVLLNLSNKFLVESEDRLIYMAAQRFPWKGRASELLKIIKK